MFGPQGDGRCQADHDLEDAQKVADKLNIELIEIDFVKEY
jgi:tRNA U34 2-thiouridine synthase MnmA/TrmU